MTVWKLADGHRGYHQNDEYEDGCDVSPRCLECPLSACKWDDPKPYRLWRMEKTDSAILAAFQNTGSERTAADALGITERTVYRAKARQRLRTRIA